MITRIKISQLGVIFYNIFLVLFRLGIRLAALVNPKAKKWVKGRHQIFERMAAAIPANEKVIWMHCASLGEFEQGRPLFEKLRQLYPNHKYLLTFFSPSGYEVRKDYKGADWVFYLPMDGARTARRFLEIVQPSLVIFVKYEFWYYYLKKMKYRNVPVLLVSAIFRQDSSFFKWYSGLQRKMLSRFDHLFVQDQSSKDLLGRIGMENNCTVTGDTRFDRVIEIAEAGSGIPLVAKFVGNKKAIIAGSTWPADEQVLQEALTALNDPSVKLVIAPHEIHKEHIDQLQQLFPQSLLYSLVVGAAHELDVDKANVLIIDNIGMLSQVYRYGRISYIGGGFGKGIHNTLEAAVYGRPVVFGPAHQKFMEARDLVDNGGGFTVKDAGECTIIFQKLLQDDIVWQHSCEQAKGFVYANKGASQKIIAFIQEKRLLTS